MPKKLFNRESERTCPVCEVYTRYSQDDLYLTKFKCCYRCYIMHVEGREEKWLNSQKQNSEKFQEEKQHEETGDKQGNFVGRSFRNRKKGFQQYWRIHMIGKS